MSGKNIFTFDSNRNSMSRIDRFNVSSGLFDDFQTMTVEKIPNLQHRFLKADFNVSFLRKCGPSFWKMNFPMIKYSETIKSCFEKILRKFLNHSINLYGLEFLESWDQMKTEISETAKKISIEISKEKRLAKFQLENDIEFLYHKTALFPKNKFFRSELQKKLEIKKKFEFEEIRKRIHKTHFSSLLSDRHTLFSSKQAQKSSAKNVFFLV